MLAKKGDGFTTTSELTVLEHPFESVPIIVKVEVCTLRVLLYNTPEISVGFIGPRVSIPDKFSGLDLIHCQVVIDEPEKVIASNGTSVHTDCVERLVVKMG